MFGFIDNGVPVMDWLEKREQVEYVRLASMTMLPTLTNAPARLADVMPSCLSALTLSGMPVSHSSLTPVVDNSLSLPEVDHAVVVLIDGLGFLALVEHSGHARHLNNIGSMTWAGTALPSTTAVNLTTLTTGQPPGVHGLVGYSVRDPQSDRIVNQLTGWGSNVTMNPETWQRCETVCEKASLRGIDVVAIGAGRYEHSGLTYATLRGSRYVGVNTLDEAVDAAISVISAATKSLVYLYIPELDMAGHAEGVDSPRWRAELEKIDDALARLAKIKKSHTGVFITADHGMVDVPSSKHVYFDRVTGLCDDIRLIGGEPRFLHLYGEPGVDPEPIAERWKEKEHDRAWVLTRRDAIAAGIFGKVDESVVPRIGDVVVLAKKRAAYYDESQASAASLLMVGQHGSATDYETHVPLIGWGAFAEPIARIVHTSTASS